jgi:hypothetical protein
VANLYNLAFLLEAIQRIYQTPEVAQRRELYLSLEKEARSYLISFLQKIQTP